MWGRRKQSETKFSGHILNDFFSVDNSMDVYSRNLKKLGHTKKEKNEQFHHHLGIVTSSNNWVNSSMFLIYIHDASPNKYRIFLK